MDIILYNNISDDDTINKNITLVDTLTGSLKNECDIESPIIVIEHSGVVGANYCYIPEFGRFYYIKNQVIISNNRVSLQMSVDVLETYKNSILGLSAIIDNSTSNNDNYMPSNLWVSKVKTKTDVINFPNGLNDTGSYILITAGG